MSKVTAELGLPKIAGLLRKVLESGKTGLFVLATEDNRSAYFVIEAGNIRNIVFQQAKGQEALDEILQLPKARCKFTLQKNVNVVEVAEELRDWSKTLQALEGMPPTPALESNRPAAPPPSREEPANQTLGRVFKPAELLPIVVEEAVEYLGPMAPLVCQESFSDTPEITIDALFALLDKIGSEFDGPNQVSEFKKRVYDRIDNG